MGIKKNGDFRYDLKLSEIAEDRLKEVFQNKTAELKDDYAYGKNGNLFIEFKSRGELSGIKTTEADYWFQELWLGKERLGYIAVTSERLKKILNELKAKNKLRVVSGGDDGTSKGALITLNDVFPFGKNDNE